MYLSRYETAAEKSEGKGGKDFRRVYKSMGSDTLWLFNVHMINRPYCNRLTGELQKRRAEMSSRCMTYESAALYV